MGGDRRKPPADAAHLIEEAERIGAGEAVRSQGDIYAHGPEPFHREGLVIKIPVAHGAMDHVNRDLFQQDEVRVVQFIHMGENPFRPDQPLAQQQLERRPASAIAHIAPH